MVFLFPNFLKDAEISAIRPQIRVILHIFHCACAKRPYFHFRSKIWRQHRVPRPRFPERRKYFGDSRTFKADIGSLNICMGFQDLLAWNRGFGGQNRERNGAILTPNELVLPFGVLTSVPSLVRVNQEMRPWECPQTDRLADANRFYNLSHAICYSYGTDNNRFVTKSFLMHDLNRSWDYNIISWEPLRQNKGSPAFSQFLSPEIYTFTTVLT